MALLDLLGRRWTLRIIWELHVASPSPVTFRSLQQKCEGMSSSVLNQRLHELRAARVVSSAGSGYALTDTGSSLVRLLEPLDKWAQEWGTHLEPDLRRKEET